MTESDDKRPSCRTKLSVNYRSAPQEVLEDGRLSSDAKVLATWSFMKGNGWEFKIGYALRVCNISEKRWSRKVKPELTAAGYFIQSKGRGVSVNGRQGVIVWDNVMTDAPLLVPPSSQKDSPSPQKVGMQKVGMPIVGMPRGGATETKVNKGSIKQERESIEAPADAATTVEEAFSKLQKAGARVKNADLARDSAAIFEARALASRFGLSEDQIVAALAECRYPSKAWAAIETAVKAKATQANAAALAQAKADGIARIAAPRLRVGDPLLPQLKPTGKNNNSTCC